MGKRRHDVSRLPLVLSVLAVLTLARAAGRGRRRLTAAAQQPYDGVRCPGPNAMACDRIGLAVWLVRPAIRLTAPVAGKPIRMAIPSRFRKGRGSYYCAHNCYFEGALHPVVLLTSGPLHIRPDAGKYYWEGRHPRSLRVRLAAFYRDGSRAATTVRIWLRPPAACSRCSRGQAELLLKRPVLFWRSPPDAVRSVTTLVDVIVGH